MLVTPKLFLEPVCQPDNFPKDPPGSPLAIPVCNGLTPNASCPQIQDAQNTVGQRSSPSSSASSPVTPSPVTTSTTTTSSVTTSNAHKVCASHPPPPPPRTVFSICSVDCICHLHLARLTCLILHASVTICLTLSHMHVSCVNKFHYALMIEKYVLLF